MANIFSLQFALLWLVVVPVNRYAQDKKQEKLPVISFAHLKDDQQIMVDYESQGCYHHTHFTLTYSNQPFAHFSQQENVKISPKQKVQLDNLLAFYRRPKTGRCTTVDHIKIMLMEQGKILARESFIDASGWTTLIPTLLQCDPDVLRKIHFKKEDIDAVRNIVTFDEIFQAAK